MHNADTPVATVENDLLGRAAFSKQLGNAIYSYDGEESITVALYGKWGSGKTSVINMALQQVEELSKDAEEKPVIIHFSPWNYSMQENLILQFFACLQAHVETPEDNTWVDAVAGLTASIPGIGNIVGPIVKKKLATKKSFEQVRTSLKKHLNDYKSKIIVVIDDIDRMSNDQIRDIFQLVKQFANFPNMIYLLSMDRDVVVRALSEVQNRDGEEYLDKIVQIPFIIPDVDQQRIQEVFLKLLDDIIDKREYQLNWDPWYWQKIFENCIKPFVSNLGDVNRVLDTFTFRMGVFREEICFEDILALTVLEVLEPEVYQWIADNEALVCGSEIPSLTVVRAEPEENRKRYCDELKAFNADDPEASLRAVAALFPVFAECIGESFWVYEASAEKKAHSRMRIAQRERYDLFFSMDINRIKVSRQTINGFITDLQPEDMKKAIYEINTIGETTYFLNQLEELVDDVPHERLVVLIETMCSIQSEFEEAMNTSIFDMTMNQQTSRYISKLFTKIGNKDKCFNVIESMIRKEATGSLTAIGQQISLIEGAYIRNDEQYQWVTEEQLEQIKNDYSLAVKRISEK